ncbi:MAG: serine hydrolase [Pirellulales bacterium]
MLPFRQTLWVTAVLCGGAMTSRAGMGQEAEDLCDLVLRGGRVVDGTGAPWYLADVGIRHGRIVAIGRVPQAHRTLDVSGLVVAPGFIDLMGQSASVLLDHPEAAANLLAQGITTINCGEGVSAAPPTDDQARTVPWRTMAEYFQYLDMRGLPVNVTQTVGHTQVRLKVLGEVDRRPTPEELEQMKQLVREGMEAGAIGVSTSLIYPPAVYADTAEIAALVQVSGEFGGRYFTHMRNEGDRLLAAIDEALEIGRTGGTPVHIFHLKAAGRQNWYLFAQALDKIRAARMAGQQVTADIYPYVNNGLGIAAFIHPRHFAAGEAALLAKLGDTTLRQTIRREMETDTSYENWYRHIGQDWSKVVIGGAASERYAPLAGQHLAAVAQACGEDPWDTFFGLVAARAFALPESMSEDNLQLALRQEFISFCTDVGPAGGSRIATHPRAFGAFPRIFSRYVRDRQVVSLERAVAQASAVAANEVLAYDRGRIAPGLAADLVVFDPQMLADQATFVQPQKLAVGVRHVMVNGELVWEDGKQTARRPGRVLRGPGYRPAPRPTARSAATDVPSLDAFFQEFLERHRVPGCAVAVSRGAELLYAQGFGWADIERREPVTPASLFRIASISKPITAVAVLRLVEEGKLRLDDRIFDIVRETPHLPPGTEPDDRLATITVRQLLQHRGGWDRDKSFDAMFQSVRFAQSLGIPPPAGARDVIRCMFAQKLDFAPGERYAYSNFGYNLLGRAIEQVSGETYEAYVRRTVLEPAGATTMRLGRTLADQRAPQEVCYYDPAMGPSVFAADGEKRVRQPYGAWHLEAMDAHGGWLASALDLVRFAGALDPQSARRLLSPASLTDMLAPPTPEPEKDDRGRPKPSYYALGWNVVPVAGPDKVNSWHTGSLPGTATILIRRHDGLNVAVLFNARISPYADHLTRALDGPPIHRALDRVSRWPAQPLWSN